MFKIKSVVAAAGLLALPVISQAAAPTLGEVLDASGISMTGHASASFAYQKLKPASPAPSSATNTFGFDQAELLVSKLPAEGFGGLVDVYAGQDVSGGNYNYGGGFNKFGPGDSGSFNLHQAYAQYANGGLAIIGGKFATLAGYEVASDTGNTNATRSILFGAQPFTLTGVRGSYKFNDIVTAMLGFNNSAGGATVDFNDQKTTEIGIALAPVTGLTAFVTDYIGNEGAAGTGNKTNLLDVVVGYTIGDLSLALNADHNTSKQENVSDFKFTGFAFYANYQIVPAFRAGIRAEAATTKDEIATPGDKTTLNEITLTGDFVAAKNFDLVTDLRFDSKKVETAGVSTKDKATTFVVKGVFKF